MYAWQCLLIVTGMPYDAQNPKEYRNRQLLQEASAVDVSGVCSLVLVSKAFIYKPLLLSQEEETGSYWL